jgi:transglutaminase-like putative cysteine protease
MAGVEALPTSWQVGCTLTFVVEEPTAIALQVGVAAAPGRTVDDSLEVTLDGQPLPTPVREIRSRHGGRISRFEARPGLLRVTYQAVAAGGSPVSELGHQPAEEEQDELAQLEALRPSRYCPSDALLGFASGELDVAQADDDLARAVVGWVTRRTAYTLGSSGPLDTAVETLLTGQGVCRDFAHLVIGLARAVGLPARLVAAYAPGLNPMDFHAVAEVHVEGAWHVFDSTGLAPRPSLLRIATGRDAADTAFADVLSGVATLTGIEVRAIVDGTLPADDGTTLVRLP